MTAPRTDDATAPAARRRILLTNDDGVDSPALVPFARALAALGDVTVVVPDRQRSWIAKAITRHDDIALAEVERDGVAITACTGYPADAAQLGIHIVCAEPPDLVVSGINVGYNHGTAFVLSSGTVGAAVEGWISGIPSIALSTAVLDTPYREWERWAHTPGAADAWTALADTCAGIVGDVVASGLARVADVVNINAPFTATADTPRRVTRVGRVRYARLFDAVGPRRYRHSFVELSADDDGEDTDVGVNRDGMVSITALRMPESVDVPDDVRNAVETPS